MSIVVDLNSFNKHHRLKENILKSGVLRTTRFWYKSARNNRLDDYFNIGRTEAVAFANTIDQMFTLLNTHYPDAWDIHIDTVHSRNTTIKNIKIIIKFSQITITNSRDESHEIKDLYVVLPLILNSDYKLIIGRPGGVRGTLSFAEKQSRYLHSHLTGNDSSTIYQFNESHFCIGRGPLTDVLDRIEMNDMSIEDFEAILVFLDDFVRWESIEGVPYKYIRNISEYSTRSTVNIHTVNYERMLEDNKISEVINTIRDKAPSLSFNYYKDRIILNSDEVLSEAIKDYIFTQNSSVISVLIVKKEEDIYFAYSESDNGIVNNEGNRYTIFRGQEYQFTVENPTEEIVSGTGYEVNPVYLDLLVNKLNSKIYENAVRKSIAEQQA